MSGVIQFIGHFATDWLTPQECRALKSAAQLYRVRDPYSVVVPGRGTATIPRGFVTNLASVPWWAQSYVGTEHPSLNSPAAFHDYGYSEEGAIFSGLPPLTREEVDDLFRILLLACGMRSSQAWVLHKAVRVGGAARWGAKEAA